MRYGKRLRRFYHKGAVYFITTFPENRFPYFKDPIFCQLLTRQIELGSHIKSYNTYAYVILPEHVHILLQPIGNYNISKVMHYIKRNSSRNINRIIFENVDNRISIKKSDKISEDDYEKLIKFEEFVTDLKVKFQKTRSVDEKNIPKFKWHHRFIDTTLKRVDSMDNFINYILYNPIKHKVTDDPVDYPWLYIKGSEDFTGR